MIHRVQTQPDNTEEYRGTGEYMYEVQRPSAENLWKGAYKCKICKFPKWSNLATAFAHNQVSLHGISSKDHGTKKKALKAKYKEEWAAARNPTPEGEEADNDAVNDDADNDTHEETDDTNGDTGDN